MVLRVAQVRGLAAARVADGGGGANNNPFTAAPVAPHALATFSSASWFSDVLIVCESASSGRAASAAVPRTVTIRRIALTRHAIVRCRR